MIVVPTHRSQPTLEEMISLRQLARVMSKREIVILTPRGIDTTTYKKLLPTASHVGLDPRWMSSHASYNRLIISPLLSSLFTGYSHLLLCEPDALILSDALNYWCQQPYDFMGAPWFQPIPFQEGIATFIPGANSGFSLFRLSAMRMVTSSWRRWYPIKHALGDLRSSLRGNEQQFRKGILGLYPGGLLRGAHLLYSSFCDQYWSLLVPRILPSFRVAPPEVAVRFAWEKWSHLCMEMCRGHLPLGIHAWAKYDFDYLAPHLLAAGVDLSGMPPWVPPEWRTNWTPPIWPVGKVV
ncbi:MAG: DUF5672 family protein [Cyanobium sp. CZS 25K]|nr:DUF5672 family protein [Cyanobium sp. CZS25K]